MSIINHLQHRIQETKQGLQAATERMQQAQAERDMLAAELTAYEKSLAAEMRRESGASAPIVAKAERLPFEQPGTASVNKAEFARNFVRQHADIGVTSADIFAAFQEAGIPIKKTYIYSLVQRLQEQNAIKMKRGRYYPIIAQPESTKEDEAYNDTEAA